MIRNIILNRGWIWQLSGIRRICKGSKDKRIVFFVGTLKEGGAERVISILSRKMQEQGFSVQILLYYDREIFYEIGSDVKITVVQKESGSLNILRNLLWVRRFIKANADVIISFLAPFNIMALAAHTGLRSTIIVADRNDPRFIPVNPAIRKLRNLLYRFSDGVVLQTTHNRDYFSKTVRRKSVVISNPIDLGEKAGMGLATKKRHEIVSVGRLMPQKNQAMLLRAFTNISTDFPEYCLTIYGEGPERESLEKLTAELGIKERVNLPGSVKDVHDRIACSELFILSSNYEGMPNALIEAMCLGLPCISTNVSGAADLIVPGENGEIVEVGDTDALTHQMRHLLSDQGQRDRFARNAVELNSKLEVDKIVKEWISYISTL